MASAATMNVYVRKWTQTSSTNTYEGTVTPNPFGLNPVVKVKGVTSGMTYKAALEKAESVGLNTTWDKKIQIILHLLDIKIFCGKTMERIIM